MRGLNKVTLIGNVGNKPEIRQLPNGNPVANITLATSEQWKDKQTNQLQTRTERHRVVVFGKLAEIAEKHLKKGSKVYIEGKLQTRKWQTEDGQDKYTTEVVVDMNGQMLMLDTLPNQNNQGVNSGQPPHPQQATPTYQYSYS